MFFYNPSTRTSVWDRPEELVGRADVNKLIGNPPEECALAVTPQQSTAANISLKRDHEEDETNVAKKSKSDNAEVG